MTDQPHPPAVPGPYPPVPAQPAPVPPADGPAWPQAGVPGVAAPGFGVPAPGQPVPGGYPAAYPAPPGVPTFPVQPPPQGGTNGFAVASLILGILGGVLLSTIFGFVALSQIRKRGQRGRGLAIGGLIASGVWASILAIAIGYGIATSLDENGTTRTNDGSVSVTTLKPGDCLAKVAEAGSILNVPVVPCGTPHEGEVFAVFDLPDGPWPGTDKVAAQAEDRCGQEFDKYAKAPDDKLELFYLHPLQSSWWRDRGVTCIATDPTGPRTGSIRR